MTFFTLRTFKESLQVITDHDEDFTNDGQKDAAEFLIKFLTFVSDRYIAANIERINPIEGNFDIIIQKIQICGVCQNRKVDNEFHRGFTFYAHLLEDRLDQDLVEILQNYLESEIKELYCDSRTCKKLQSHFLNYVWVKAPPCLIVVMRRYVRNEATNLVRKLCSSVSAPEHLRM